MVKKLILLATVFCMTSCITLISSIVAAKANKEAMENTSEQVDTQSKEESEQTSTQSKEENKTVTLVVSGDGATKDAATTIALRSAIEQALGVFVSANTTILNDELVKDEIAMVSSGNIQSYKEVGCVQLDNGNTSVSLQATVSISKLVAYAQSKGSECEFAGAMFGQQLKLIELNKQNAEKAIENMFAQLEAIAPYMYDYELEVGNPKVNGDVDIKVIYRANETTNSFGNIIMNTLNAIAVSNYEEVKRMGIKLYMANIRNYELKEFTSKYTGVSLEHWSDVEKIDVQYYYINIDEVMKRIVQIHLFSLNNFEVKDNLGNIYPFPEYNEKEWESSRRTPYGDFYHDDDRNYLYVDVINPWKIYHRRLLGNLWIMFFSHSTADIAATRDFRINIPIEQLVKINNFTINKKESL